jgi:hypothetical protein
MCFKELNVRGQDGQFTREYEQMMMEIGKPIATFETATIPRPL